MSGYRRVNYYELCRLCTSSEGNKMNIFRDEGRRRQLQSKIEACLPIQVLEEDSLPKIVCHECVKKLENYFEFRETVVSAESMLDSYFTSLRFSEDFLKEGKVYVKSTEKKRPSTPEDESAKSDKVTAMQISQITTEQQTQHQQPVVVSNVNASNIQIISGVQARVQQYKCAMQMQPGGVAAAVVEATAETHYSYQQQTSQQVSQQQQQQSNQTQNQIVQQQNHSQQAQIQQTQNQIQNQNHMSQQTQPQINQQTQRQITQQQSQPQITQQQNQPQISHQQQSQTQITQQQQQNQSQINQQLHQLQRQQREFEKQQRHLQQIEKQQVQIVQQQEQQQTQIVQAQHQNNNIILKSEASTEQNQQVIQKVQNEPQENDAPNQTVQTYTTVQATPEVLLSLGFKEAALAAQTVVREDSKDFKEFIKVTPDDAISRNSIGQISEFLRIRSVPEPTSLITVNPQVISQSTRNPSCRDCGKSFTNLNQLNNHSCNGQPLMTDVSDISGKEDPAQTAGSPFSCDVCGKPFKRKEHLFQHRKLHTGERPYVCMTCSKAFSRKEHLVRHSNSHTGQKTHECELCCKTFSRKDNLHKHRKTHGVSGPYICDTCGKSFVVKHYYLMHLTTHAPTIVDGMGCEDPLPFKCDLCHKAFSVKQYLTTHKLRHRPRNSSNNANVLQQANASNSTVNMTASDVSSSASLNNGSVQAGNGSVVEIQSVIEGNEQQNGSFAASQYHGNIQQFQ